jgi:3-oxoacyl-[acyl-carrier protein] reductase
MDLGLKNKVVLVTGSSRGIGRAIGLEFAREGARVVITGRRKVDVAKTVSEIEELDGQGFGFIGDISNEASIKECIEKVVEQWQGVDILVANLGSGKGERGWDVGGEEWGRLLEVNLMSGVKAVRFAVPYISKSTDGSIVFIASIAGLETLGAPPAYEAAKSAVLSYSKHLARILGEKNIRVNTVAPGNIMISGGTWDKKIKADRKSVEAMIKNEVPLKRFGLAKEVANAVIFLASSKASFVTGACLIVDGGQTRTIS